MTDRTADQIVAELAIRSRRARPVIVIGLLVIFASLLGSVIYLNVLLNRSQAAEQTAVALEKQARERAVRAEAEATRQRTTLADARAAFEAGDRRRTAALLQAAIEQTEDWADRAAATATAPVTTPPASGPAPEPKGPTPQAVAVVEVPRYAISRPSEARGQIVFIQFAGVIRRETIVGLNRSLREAGWRAQGGDRGGERTATAAGYNEVRCATDEDCAAAAELAAAVSAAHIGSRPLRVQRARVRPGTLEIYLSN